MSQLQAYFLFTEFVMSAHMLSSGMQHWKSIKSTDASVKSNRNRQKNSMCVHYDKSVIPRLRDIITSGRKSLKDQLPTHWGHFDTEWKLTAKSPCNIWNPEYVEHMLQYMQRHKSRCPHAVMCVFLCVGGNGEGGWGGIFQKSIRAVVIAAAEGPAEGRQKVRGPPYDKGAFSMILQGSTGGPFWEGGGRGLRTDMGAPQVPSRAKEGVKPRRF